MAKAANAHITSSSLAKILREAGVPEADIDKGLATHRIAVLAYVPAAYFSRDHLERTANLPYQSKLVKLVVSGRLRVHDDETGLILYEPINHGQPMLVEGAP